MRPAIIDNHTGQLSAPKDWDEAKNGRCAELFIKVEQVDGLRFMRSSWEPEADEAMRLLAGGKLTLGVSGNIHPVIDMTVPDMPADHEPLIVVRIVTLFDGQRGIRVEGMFPACKTHRIFAEAPIKASLAEAVAVAMMHVEQLAKNAGWMV